jgi:hypothetical protein
LPTAIRAGTSEIERSDIARWLAGSVIGASASSASSGLPE